MSIRVTGASLLATAIVALAVLSAPVASAHARYKNSTPGTGALLATAPANVEIFFTEEIQKVAGTYDIEVTRDRGASVTSGQAIVDDADRTHLSVPLQTGLGPGRYVVNWKNTSDDDGDPAEGAFSFYINTQPNAVDLDNDRQLAQIGFEDVTATAAGSDSTPGAATAVATRVPATTSPGISAATPLATGAATNADNGGSGGNQTLYVVIGIAVAVAIIGLFGWLFYSRRQR